MGSPSLRQDTTVHWEDVSIMKFGHNMMLAGGSHYNGLGMEAKVSCVHVSCRFVSNMGEVTWSYSTFHWHALSFAFLKFHVVSNMGVPTWRYCTFHWHAFTFAYFML